MEQVVEQLLHCLILSVFSFLDIRHIKEAFQSVEIVFEIDSLVVNDSFIKRAHEIAELLSGINPQSLHLFLLVLLALYDFDLLFL